MSDQGAAVEGQSALSRSGSATLLKNDLKKTKAPSKDHQSHIHFGDYPSDFMSCAQDAYCPKPPKTAKEAAALHNNKKYLRGVHWTLGGDADPMGISTAKATYKPPGPAPRDSMFGDKTSNQKTQWTLGYDNAPNHYETCHQAELSEPAILRGTASGPSEHSEAIKIARSTTITLGSEPMNYQSQSRASHINFGEQVAIDPNLAAEKCKVMRKSNFTFGAGEEKAPKTETQNQYKFHGDPASLKGHLVADIPGGGTKGLQKTHLYLGNEKNEMRSEFQKQFGGVDDLIEAAKHPCRMDPAQKADLRGTHYYLGTDVGPNNSEAAEQFGARAAPGGEKALEAERKNLLAIRKDLRATHINLGTDSIQDIVSTSKDAYSHPQGKKVRGRTEGGEQINHQKANWSVGIDNDSLRELRCTSMAQQDFADGISKANYQPNALIDDQTKADLRKAHFYIGKESFPKHSSSRDAYVHHSTAKRYVIPESVKKDLRKEHFTFGTDEGLGSNSKTTSQEAMIYHGITAYRKENDDVAEMKKKWGKVSYSAGSHDGPRESVQQADFKYRPGL
eukprot:gnl/MRDRNA2_/MRDRNA2_106741_c0_seq1.p1 gnl/MRDRNA2_/MRDRNA2_106741_c0~~gnl/MRDRNA2_/MRDRNA2_106741_c0_seq1.p1  ORF type:complete len:562 (+),score=113.97 gnl/MRDRNA2_/MRDRNA2_106741_c0_seq1:90-1775(+)